MMIGRKLGAALALFISLAPTAAFDATLFEFQRVESGLCRASGGHGGFCSRGDMADDSCVGECRAIPACKAAGKYSNGAACDLFMHAAVAPADCPSGFSAHGSSGSVTGYAGTPHASYADATCTLRNCPVVASSGESQTCKVGSSSNTCTACHTECGLRLVVRNYESNGTPYGHCFSMGFFGENCATGTFCYDTTSSAPNNVAPTSSKFVCSRTCQPWYVGGFPDVPDTYKMDDCGSECTRLSAAVCNLYKTTMCEPQSEYTACKAANSGKTIYSAEGSVWSSGSTTHNSNSTHADCGVKDSCTVTKEVSCEKVCKAQYTTAGYVPDMTTCSSAVCKPEYCRVLASYS